MGAGSSYCNKPDDQKKAHLVAILRGGGPYGNKFAEEVASYLTHPYMLAATTAERAYIELYEELKGKVAGKSLINPYEFLRFKEEHGMNSDLQAVAVICGKAFGEAFYHDWLMAKFDEYPGRAKGKLITQFGPDEAMRQMIASGKLKAVRCANLSFIHRKGPWKLAYPVDVVPWPRPILQDFSGRLLIQPVDRRVVFKAPKMATPSSRRCPGKWDGVSPESLVHIHTGRSVCVAARWRAHAGVAGA